MEKLRERGATTIGRSTSPGRSDSSRLTASRPPHEAPTQINSYTDYSTFLYTRSFASSSSYASSCGLKRIDSFAPSASTPKVIRLS